MPGFNFYYPIEVRYGDLDPQGHLNNAKYLTFMEQARIAYVQHLGLWDGNSFEDLGMILADAQITFLAPVLFGQAVRVGVRVTRFGNKSLTMTHRLEDSATGAELANGVTVLVAYDYKTNQSIPVPDNWRRRIAEFEHMNP